MRFKHSFSILLLSVLFVSQSIGQQNEHEEDQVPDASEQEPEQVDGDKFFPFDSREFVKSIFKMLDLDGKDEGIDSIQDTVVKMINHGHKFMSSLHPWFKSIDVQVPENEHRPEFEFGSGFDMKQVSLDIEKELSELWGSISRNLKDDIDSFDIDIPTFDIPEVHHGDQKAKSKQLEKEDVTEKMMRLNEAQTSVDNVYEIFREEREISKTPTETIKRLRSSLQNSLSSTGQEIAASKNKAVDNVEKSVQHGTANVRTAIHQFQDHWESMLNGMPPAERRQRV